MFSFGKYSAIVIFWMNLALVTACGTSPSSSSPASVGRQNDRQNRPYVFRTTISSRPYYFHFKGAMGFGI